MTDLPDDISDPDEASCEDLCQQRCAGEFSECEL